MLPKIGWVKIASRRYGGTVYEDRAQKILAENFDLETVEINSRLFKRGYWRILELLWQMFLLKGEKDVWILDNKTVITLPFDKTKGKKIAIIHHVDFSRSKGLAKFIDFFIEKMLYWSLKKADLIVTVSAFWQNHFRAKGYKNVAKIYNSFDTALFESLSREEVENFKRKYHLEGKPIIYLGNCQKDKGVVESYQALKDLDCHLVTSGERHVEIPALNLNLDYQGYLELLKPSSFFFLMGKLKEGWGRTAHEAMLLKTPVIGSGLGGTKELLEGGKQIICSDHSSLKEKVLFLMNNPEEREKIGQDGYNFAKSFTHEKFQGQWLKLINNLNL